MNPTLAYAVDSRQRCYRCNALTTLPPTIFDDLLQLASHLCGAPMAMIMLIDDQHLCFQASLGFSLDECSYKRAFYAQLNKNTQPHIVPDTLMDPGWTISPLIMGEIRIRFYADAPLLSAAGKVIGRLAVMDTNPHSLTPVQIELLNALARQLASQIELSRQCTTVEAELAEREHKRAALQLVNQQLGDSEERFRRLVMGAATGIATTDRTGKFSQANLAYCKTFGYTEAELLEMDFLSLIHPADQADTLHLLLQLLTGETANLIAEKRCLQKDGGLLWVRASITLMWAANGEALNLIIVTEDITQQKAVAERLKQSESLLHIASHMVRMGGWAVDLQAESVTWSDEVCAIHEVPPGYSPTLAQAFAYYAPKWRNLIRHLFDRCTQEGIPYDAKLEIITAKGRHLWVRAIGEAERDTNGMIWRIHGAFQDITEQKQTEERAHQLAGRLADTFESMTDAFCLIDQHGRFAYLNREAERIFRRARADLLHRDVWEAFPEVRETALFTAYQQAAADIGPAHLEFFYPPLAEWLEVHVYPSAEGLAVYFRVITERKQAEEKLRTSEERFRLLSSATTDAIWDWNLHTDAVWWSESFETLFGFAARERESNITWWRNHIHPADQQRVIAHIHRTIDAGNITWSQEYRFLRKDGSFAHVLDHGRVIHNAEGNPIRMVGGMTDITARKLAEAQLREQAALLDKAQDAILVRDLDHRITYWNSSAEQLYGWRACEAKGKSVRELLYADDTAFREATQQVLETGEWIGELAQLTKHGQPLIVEGRWTLVHDDLGNPRAILAINTNITERKKLEAQFLRAQRLESIGTLAGGIAHDLNNVLAPILLSITLLKQRAQGADDLTRLDRLEASVQRGADMVRQILSFARGVEGQRIPLDVGNIVQDIEKLVCDTFNPNIRTVVAIDPHLWSIAGDPTQIHQILLNLCVNARDAMPNGGQLQLSVANVVLDARYVGTDAQTKPGCYVMISVADRGSGIPAAIHDQIFEPFFTTKEVGKGTGLGLSTVQAIVKSHGGFINLHSAEGRGTVFKLYIPVLEGAPPNDEAIFAASPPHGHSEWVIVVDDDTAVRMITQQTLEAFGYQVLVAEDGAEAVAHYVQHSGEIAAFLIDMMMPVMDGMTTIETLLQINPQVKIIAASGLVTHGMTAQATQVGVTHFLQKPYTAETLLKTLACVLAA